MTMFTTQTEPACLKCFSLMIPHGEGVRCVNCNATTTTAREAAASFLRRMNIPGFIGSTACYYLAECIEARDAEAEAVIKLGREALAAVVAENNALTERLRAVETELAAAHRSLAITVDQLNLAGLEVKRLRGALGEIAICHANDCEAAPQHALARAAPAHAGARAPKITTGVVRPTFPEFAPPATPPGTVKP